MKSAAASLIPKRGAEGEGFPDARFRLRPGVLTRLSLGLCLSTSQFLTPTLCCRLSFSLTLSLSCRTGTRFLYLNGYQTVNLRIDSSILLALISNNSLNGFLLLLQSLHHLLLLGLLAFERSFLLLTFI